MSRHRAAPAANRAGFSDVLRVRVFAVLFAAETQSIMGDQLARIALSVLVFDATGSIVTTAVTYAATFLPAIAGGLLIAEIGDRRQYRAVMIACEIFRALAFAGMATPGVPLPVVIVMLMAAVAVGPVFTASEVSWLAKALDTERFRAATGLRLVTNQAAQVVGFALGGALVVVLSPRGALVVNAATFALSAVLIACLPRSGGSGRVPALTPTASAVGAEDIDFGVTSRLVLWAQPRLRLLLALSLLAGFFVVPEGLAIPVGDAVGATTTQTGFLLAAIPLGGALGAIVLVRWVPPPRRVATSRCMAFGAGLPLLPTLLSPNWVVLVLLWGLSGACAAYQIEVTTTLVGQLPEQARARLVGVVGACLIFVQGAGILVFGLLAQLTGATAAVSAAGLVGAACALGLCRYAMHADPARVTTPSLARAVE